MTRNITSALLIALAIPAILASCLTNPNHLRRLPPAPGGQTARPAIPPPSPVPSSAVPSSAVPSSAGRSRPDLAPVILPTQVPSSARPSRPDLPQINPAPTVLGPIATHLPGVGGGIAATLAGLTLLRFISKRTATKLDDKISAKLDTLAHTAGLPVQPPETKG